MEKLITDGLAAFEDKANLIGAAVVALVGGVFGANAKVFGFFLLLNVVDFYYGRAKARRTGTLSSAKGAQGVMKKVSYWVVIAIAFQSAEILVGFGARIGVGLGFLRLLGWFTLGVYILNEMTSIVENLVVLGIDVPPFFVRGLNAARKAVDAAGDKIIPPVREGETDE